MNVKQSGNFLWQRIGKMMCLLMLGWKIKKSRNDKSCDMSDNYANEKLHSE